MHCDACLLREVISHNAQGLFHWQLWRTEGANKSPIITTSEEVHLVQPSKNIQINISQWLFFILHTKWMFSILRINLFSSESSSVALLCAFCFDKTLPKKTEPDVIPRGESISRVLNPELPRDRYYFWIGMQHDSLLISLALPIDRHKHSRSLSHPHTLAHYFNRECRPHETETGRWDEIISCFRSFFFPCYWFI